MIFYKEFYNSVSLLIRKWITNRFIHTNSEVILMQKKYDSETNRNFLCEFHNIILLTYRHSFPNISVSVNCKDLSNQSKKENILITSDVGWGCMIRVTQMSIVHGICMFLKRNKVKFSIKKLLENFQDDEKAAFSIHKIVINALLMLGITPTSWIGPTSSSIIANKLINENQNILEDILVNSIIFEKGTFYRNLAKDHYSNINSNCCTFIWLCLKLGTSKFNVESYKNSIISVMSNIPQFVCIAGGHNYFSSALLIVGASDKFLYCLDPHIKILPFFSMENYREKEFIQDKPTKIFWNELNPSLSMIFISQNLIDFENLCFKLIEIDPEMFEILENEELVEIKELEFESGFFLV